MALKEPSNEFHKRRPENCVGIYLANVWRPNDSIMASSAKTSMLFTQSNAFTILSVKCITEYLFTRCVIIQFQVRNEIVLIINYPNRFTFQINIS